MLCQQESELWRLQESSLLSKNSTLESELSASLEKNSILQRRLETTQQRYQLLVEKQAESTSSNSREVESLNDECKKLKFSLELARSHTLELEQANIRHQESERAALASLADVQSVATTTEQRCRNLEFELEAAKLALEELRLLREENTDLKADLDFCQTRLKRYEEEDYSSYEADSNETSIWERGQLVRSPTQGSIKAWVGNNYILEHMEDLDKSRTSGSW